MPPRNPWETPWSNLPKKKSRENPEFLGNREGVTEEFCECGGELLEAVDGEGNPIYRCANCQKIYPISEKENEEKAA